jgi:hypothetical protein
MCDRDGDAQEEHRDEIGGERAGRLAERKSDGQSYKQRLSRQSCGRDSEQGAADRDADGVA